MFELAPKELKNVLEFIREGKYEYTLQLLKDFEERKNNSLQDKVFCHLMRCNLYLTQGLFRKAVNLAEQTYKESLDLEKDFFSVDALFLRANALLNGWGDVKQAKKIVEQGEKLLKTLIEEPEINKNRREEFVVYLKGMCSDPSISPPGDVDLALKHYNQSLALGESLEDKVSIGVTLLRIANIVGLYKGNLDLALNYTERALALFKEINHKFFFSWALHMKATIYHNKGEVTRSIPIYEQSLAISKELNHKLLVSNTLNNMADAFRMRGKLNHALECSEQSLEIFSDFGHSKPMANFHDFLIQILIEKGDLEQAQRYFSRLEQLNNQLNDRNINEIYLYNKALILKESTRISNRGKAEEILKQILEDDDASWEVNLRVLLTLSELLLSELQMTGDLEILEEIEPLITQLLEMAEESHSYWIWGETFLLQAKLALVSLKLKDARRLLTRGQQIAEKFGLTLLARKISNEHDELLKQLSIWENLKKSEAPLTDRFELSRLDFQMKNMIQKREIDLPDMEDEEPVVILFFSEAGIPVFSHLFIKEWSFQDHLFGGFLTAVNSFSDEMFSKGLDRASFGEYTLLMNAASPLLVCYLFKGQSYSAQHRLRLFIDKLKNDGDIWQAFEKYYQMNREIELKDIPTLETVIKEIFTERINLITE